MANEPSPSWNSKPEQSINTIQRGGEYPRLCYELAVPLVERTKAFVADHQVAGGLTEMTRRATAVVNMLDDHLRIGAHRHDPIETRELTWDLSRQIEWDIPTIAISVNISDEVSVILERLIAKYPFASFSAFMNTGLHIYLELVALREAGYHICIFDMQGEDAGLMLYGV